MRRLGACLALAIAVSPGAPKIPPTRPEVQGVFPHGGQRGAAVDVLIRGKNLQGATDILSPTPKLSGVILSVEHRLGQRWHVRERLARRGARLHRHGLSQACNV
jgi:hypothetical protein